MKTDPNLWAGLISVEELARCHFRFQVEIYDLSCFSSFGRPGFLIRIRIGSGFLETLDPDPHFKCGSVSTS